SPAMDFRSIEIDPTRATDGFDRFQLITACFFGGDLFPLTPCRFVLVSPLNHYFRRFRDKTFDLLNFIQHSTLKIQHCP
ncbi:MAG: hypothetical protein ACTILC_11070, partial [Oceanisphaera sp.]